MIEFLIYYVVIPIAILAWLTAGTLFILHYLRLPTVLRGKWGLLVVLNSPPGRWFFGASLVLSSLIVGSYLGVWGMLNL